MALFLFLVALLAPSFILGVHRRHTGLHGRFLHDRLLIIVLVILLAVVILLILTLIVLIVGVVVRLVLLLLLVIRSLVVLLVAHILHLLAYVWSAILVVHLLSRLLR